MEDIKSLEETIQKAFLTGIETIAGIIDTKVIRYDDPNYYSFLIPGGLCIMGIHQIGSKKDYVDIRWRVLIGEVTPEFDINNALVSNFEMPETCYSIFKLDGKKILVMTDIYRFLISWGAQEIVSIMKLRFGGAFSFPFAPPTISALSGDLIETILTKYQPKRLLGN